MSNATRLTDDEITLMLRDRAASPMPADLYTSVLASLRDARYRQDRLLRRGPNGPGTLLLAATLVMAGSLLVATFAGSAPPPSRPAPGVVEATPTPAVVAHFWKADQSPAFTVTRDPLDDENFYWRAMTYDQIGLKAWTRSETRSVIRQAGEALMDQLADAPTRGALRAFTFTVDPVGFHQATMLAPATPVETDERSRISYIGESGFFATMDRDGGSGPYEITSRVLVYGNGPGQLNKAALRAAGTEYPPEVLAYFTGVVPDSLGPNALALRDRIVAEAESQAPVDLADQLVTVLRSNAYTYDTDIRNRPCEDLSTAECFATFKVGHCQYYAATMAVILRDLGVPTRLAEGFLPGERAAGIERIRNSSAHAWVEVYFPGYGWVPFDPTGGALPGQVGPLPSGSPAESAAPPPSASATVP